MANREHDTSGDMAGVAARAPPDVSSTAAGQKRGPYEEYRWYTICRSCGSCSGARTYAEAEARRDSHKYVSPTNARCSAPGAIYVNRYVVDAPDRVGGPIQFEAQKKEGIQK